ncbi:hypothetical protein [Myxococcus sp. NMCA1]|uniref:hypothetical protein n=1 Tax=Myxococcus sp. NMCA1 TaxID=2996785 RepID=UPI002285C8AC|nr:hypothetical protein [Myxococcus sp. NMCA1]WAM26155.1 hypothetical protein OZ403_37465 [Myxococcus sp. NMCA1]
MRIRYRLILTGAGVLAVALGAVEFWPQPEPEPLPAALLAMAVPPPPPAQPPRIVPAKAHSVAPPAPAPRQEAPQVSVARMAPEPVVSEPEVPEPEVPEPEVSFPPPEDNDDIEPELPQTAQWELEKTARLAALVERDVVRLAREREAAAAEGDVRRGEQLDVLLQRNLEQLRELHDEVRRLATVVNGVAPTE